MQKLSVKTVVSAGLSCALAACALLGSAPAQAQGYPGGSGGYPGSPGHWDITYTNNGVDVNSDGGEAWPVSQPVEFGLADYAGDGHDAYASSVGSATAHLSWNPGDGNTAQTNPPPVDVYVRVFVDANATADSADDGSGNVTPPVINVDDGFGDAAQTRDMGGGQIFSASNGARIFHISNPTQQTTLDVPTFSFSANAESVSYCIVQTRYAVSLLDYSLTLSRAGAINETVGSDGTVSGDTTYSYDQDVRIETGDTIKVPIPNWQTFHPRFGADWSWDGYAPPEPDGGGKDVTWSWAPSGGTLLDPDTKEKSDQEMDPGSPNKNVDGDWEGAHSANLPKTITYTATDNKTNVTATAKYKLTMHDEWEKFIDDPDWPPTDVDHYYPVSVGGTAIWIGQPEGASGPAHATWGWTATGTVGMTMAFNAGFKVTDLLNFGMTFTPSFSFSVASNLSLSADVPAGYHVYPLIHTHHLQKHSLVDHYIPAGHDKNPARVDVNGTGDGAWEQTWDDASTKAIEPEFSLPQPLDDWSQRS